MIGTLLNIFIPEKIKNYYILPIRILTISFEHNLVVGLLSRARGRDIRLEKTISVTYHVDLKNTLHNAKKHALQELISQIGAYDKLIVVVSGGFATYKEITVPFTSERHIRSVLPLHIEGSLPFPLEEAALDFLILKQYEVEAVDYSDVMVIAIQKKYKDEQLALFNELNVSIDVLMPDVIGHYALYKNYLQQPGTTQVVVDITDSTTHILFFKDEALLFIRSIRVLASDKELLKSIKFTIQSLLQDTYNVDTLDTCFLIGDPGGKAQGPLESELGVSFVRFDFFDFLHKKQITYSEDMIAEQDAILKNFIPFFAFISLEKTFSFLVPTEIKKSLLLSKMQYTAAALLTFLLLGTLATHIYFQTSLLKQEVSASQEQVVAVLQREFPFVSEALKSKNQKKNSKKNAIINDILDRAQLEIKKEEAVWAVFVLQRKQSFLQCLLDLSTHIDREVLGLNLKRMVLNKESVLLEGKVRNFEMLAQFEQWLRDTQLFSTIPDLQKIEFTVTLPLAVKESV